MPAQTTAAGTRPADGADLDLAAEAAQMRYAWRVFSVTTLGVMLVFINSSTLNVALPVVSRHFGATPGQASWILLSYMLVNTIFILVFGRLADLIGRRRLYLLGLAVFVLGGCACGFAPSANWLIAFRVVQAIGGAAIITNTTALLTDAFPKHALSIGLGMNSSAAAAAQVLGPVVGGAVATWFGWRAVFLFNLPIGLVALVWAGMTLRGVRFRTEERFDLLGAVLSLLMLGGFIVALSMGGSQGWDSAVVILGALVAVLVAPVFLLSQLRRRDPLVDLSLFRDRDRGFAYVTTTLMPLVTAGTVLISSLFLQAVQGYDAFGAGWRVMPAALGTMTAALCSGRLLRRFSSSTLCATGMSLAGVGLAVLLVNLRADIPYPLVGAGLLLLGLGSGTFLTPNTSSIMISVPSNRRGIANGIRSMLQNTGQVSGAALSLAIITSPLAIEAKRAVYSGAVRHFTAEDLAALLGSYRVALSVLLFFCVLGAVLSLLRRTRR
ncbi:MFS transporter [Roseomonas elaeocarpi]|uniref:MFS transporter n=1 Tax=Roseomonas elaeocarpi TaxID=907779 RepID=A0ABV6JZ86_9PROT